MSEQNRKLLSVDFDGVIHGYSRVKNFRHDFIHDHPVPGAMTWIYDTLNHHDIAIFSSRGVTADGRAAMKTWLRHHAEQELGMSPRESEAFIKRMTFPTEKPPAHMSIDDRAWQFTGANFPTLPDIDYFQPWNR